MLKGEKYDARIEKNIRGWEKADFDDRNWEKIRVNRNLKVNITSHPGVPVKIIETIKVKSITKLKNRKYVFDMGQNFAGTVRLKISGKKGQKIILRFAEMLKNDCNIYTDNLRMSRSTDTYICKGSREEIWEPKFTYHGFRYVEVCGLEKYPSKDLLTGLVIHADLNETGSFFCSNKLINRIYKNIKWSQKSNYMDIPTDCPQRDERLGWTGYAVNFIPTALYNFEVAQFYTKWLKDVNDAQEKDSSYPAIAPNLNLSVGPLYPGAARVGRCRNCCSLFNVQNLWR